MPVSVSFYNHTRKLFANNEVDISNLKVMLRDSDGVFNAAHTDTGDLAGSEVSGNGWTAGGEDIDNAAVTVTDTNAATLDGDNISVEASGGAISARYGVVIDSTGSAPWTVLFHIDFDETKTADAGTDFNVNWNADGIARWRAPT